MHTTHYLEKSHSNLNRRALRVGVCILRATIEMKLFTVVTILGQAYVALKCKFSFQKWKQG